MIAARDFGNRDGGLGGVGFNDSINDGLWCQSVLTGSGIGIWKLPNGTDVANDPSPNGPAVDDPSEPIHIANKPGQVGLLRTLGISYSPYQGMYTCTIPDENGDMQTLVVWAAGNSAYDGKVEV